MGVEIAGEMPLALAFDGGELFWKRVGEAPVDWFMSILNWSLSDWA